MSSREECRKQWFQIVDPSTWQPTEKVFHAHHPDYYAEDVRRRLSHHRGTIETGAIVTACGLEHDPRLAVISECGEEDCCPDCVRVTEEGG